MRKYFVGWSCCLLAILVTGRLGLSADIDWQVPSFEIETDADIDVSGTNIRAYNVSGIFDIIDVTIDDQVLEFEPVDPGWGGLTNDGNFYTTNGLTTGNDDLDQVLNDHGWASGGEGTEIELVLEDLTVGTNYQIQLIGAADDRDCCRDRRVVVVDENQDFLSDFFGRQTDWDEDGVPGPGSVIGRFVADDVEQSIIVMGTSDAPDLGPPNDPGMSAYILSEVTAGAPRLEAGDANQDLEFNQLDLVKVQIAAKYLTGQPATWGEGDWDGAPGGTVGDPPAGDGLFNQLDIIAALNGGKYLTGPYAAIAPGGQRGDGQTSIVYNTSTGEVAVDAPAGVELTSVNIDSAAGIFTGDPAQNLGGSFDNDADNNIFKATFGGSFGSISFGTVAQAGLSEEFVANDLTVVGSLDGGGDLGNVDLIYIPEPSAVVLLCMGLAGLLLRRRC